MICTSSLKLSQLYLPRQMETRYILFAKHVFCAYESVKPMSHWAKWVITEIDEGTNCSSNKKVLVSCHKARVASIIIYHGDILLA